ncbi:MAG: class I SAM-dependent methyltransferase [Thermodesulfobacteriales bacterium]|nr:MAG: class I SAM-dependent methyltransferase [Thermodesulfobacteriales bacterium]
MTKVKSSWEIEENAKYFLESERGAVPGTDVQLGIIASIVKGWCPTPSRILDLGCGDGILGRFLLESFSSASGVFIDFSDAMLDAARENLCSTPNTKIIKADFSTPGWIENGEEEKLFDVIISGFAIHHQPDSRKNELYSEIYDLLNQGGIFLNLEHVESSTPEVSKLFEEYYVDHLHSYQLKSDPNSSREEVAEGFRNRSDKDEDQLMPIEKQCGWLRDIGFKDVDCFFKQFEIGLFGGRKSS